MDYEPLYLKIGELEEKMLRACSVDDIEAAREWCKHMGLKEVKEWLHQNSTAIGSVLLEIDAGRRAPEVLRSPHLRAPFLYACVLHCTAAGLAWKFYCDTRNDAPDNPANAAEPCSAEYLAAVFGAAYWEFRGSDYLDYWPFDPPNPFEEWQLC